MTDFLRDNTALWDDKADAPGRSPPPIATQGWEAVDAGLAKAALLSIQLYLRTGTLDIPSTTTVTSLHITNSGSPTVGPETDHIGFRGQWFEGVDVANAPTSRDYVERGQRVSFSISDGATTNGSATLTSPGDGNFTSVLIGATVTGTGIPNGTTVIAVGGLTTLTMSANATATASGLRVTLATTSSSDLLYWKHRGALSPTLGLGVTPPDGSARFQVAASDAEPAMGTARFRVGPSQTGKALVVHDSTPIDRWWIDKDFFMSGASGVGVSIKAESSASGHALALADNTGATNVYGFDLPTGSGGVLRLRYTTGNQTIMDFGTDGSIRHLSTKIGFFSATPAVKPTVTGSRGGNAALASLLTALANLGLITDSTTA